MATVDIQVEHFAAERPTEHSSSSSTDTTSKGHQRNQFSAEKHLSDTVLTDDADFGAIQTKLFKRRRRASAALAGTPERALPSKCCGRCKSDLNGKLMVQCATCAFRCHLYCFSPPLKQHPGFIIRRQQTVPKGEANALPIWKCEKCEGTSVAFNLEPRLSSSAEGSPKKKIARSPNKHNNCVRLGTKTLAIESTLQIKSRGPEKEVEPSWAQPVKAQWLNNSEVTFDWYRFRSNKAEALRRYETSDEQHRNGLNELAFYSKSYALMKKTAAIWRAHAKRRRRFRHHEEHETQALQYLGMRRNVMHVLKSTNENMLKATHKLETDDEEEPEDLHLDAFNQSGFKPYSRRPPSLPLLWRGEPPSALMCWSTGERFEISEVLREVEERVCLSCEDSDAFTTDNNFSTFANIDEVMKNAYEDGTTGTELKNEDHATVDLHMVSKIIQRIFLRHHRWRRRAERAKRKRRVIEETKRRAKAQASMTLLRICVQFIMLLIKKLGQVQTKKALLLVLRDAAEETQAKNGMLLEESTGGDTAKPINQERIRQLAEIRIRRFFVRYVHHYVKIKKQVMTRRLQRWWKHKHIFQKWREASIALRHVHRDQACIRIQRIYHSYRRHRVQKSFQDLTEKHALEKLRRLLTNWILSRIAKKEAKQRVEIDHTLSLNAESVLPMSRSIDTVLEKRGMEFYQLGDFWNAASMLERLWQLKKDDFSQELQQVLAYSHHMTWYASYDKFNLLRAHELYCASLEISANNKRAFRVDPFVLQDLAIVLMHMEHFGDSLRLLAKLIEFFAREPQFPLWLLLAAVQLQQRGEWEQSAGYMSYLQDIPPPPYLERDILVLCAMSYERLAVMTTKTPVERSSYSTFAKEAWLSALRHWTHKEFPTNGTGSARWDGRVLTSRQKWDLLTNLGMRALEQGHYLIACRTYIYALEREGPVSCKDSCSSYTRYYEEASRAAWWNLADAFRHLGHLDLYLDAAQRSQVCLSIGQDNAEVDGERLNDWRELADRQACSFQSELKTVTSHERLQQLSEH